MTPIPWRATVLATAALALAPAAAWAHADAHPGGGDRHCRLAADAGLAGPPAAVMPPQPFSATMVMTVPAGHALEATRKVRWGAGSS